MKHKKPQIPCSSIHQHQTHHQKSHQHHPKEEMINQKKKDCVSYGAPLQLLKL